MQGCSLSSAFSGDLSHVVPPLFWLGHLAFNARYDLDDFYLLLILTNRLADKPDLISD